MEPVRLQRQSNMVTMFRPFACQLDVPPGATHRHLSTWKATCSDQPQPVPTNNCPSLPSDSYSFTIAIIDIFTLQTSTFICRDADSLSPAIDFVQAGFLSHVPMSPSVAISLRTLEHFCHLHLRKPSFSVEAYVKVICDSYKVLLLSTLSFASLPVTGIRYPINVAGAQYLPLLILTWPYFSRLSRKLPLLSVAVPPWCILNSCPPCTYELEDEPLLPFTWMYVLDGSGLLLWVTDMIRSGEL
jgi:hypothetical protein